MMFGSKSVSWKKNEKTIARYLRTDSIHKSLRKKIDLDLRKDRVLVWTDSEHPSPIIPERFDTVDLSSKEFLSKHSSILFWSTISTHVEVPIKHRTNTDSPFLNGKIGLEAQIDQVNKMDYGVGKKLVDEFFKGGSGRDVLDSGAMHSIVGEAIRGKQGDFLEGISEENLMDDAFQQTIRKNAEAHIAESLAPMGLEIRSLTVSWRPTSRMKTKARESQTEAMKDRILADTKREAFEDLASEGKDALVDIQKKSIADGIKIEIEGDLQVEREKAKRKVSSEKLKTAAEERDFDRENRKLDAELDVEIGLGAHKAEMEKKSDMIQLDRERAEIARERAEIEAIKTGSKSDLFSNALDSAAGYLDKGGSEDGARKILKDLMIHLENGKTFEAADLIHEETYADLEMGALTAEEIDLAAEAMRKEASDGRRSREERSYLWAGVATYERFRGNKEGRMEKALENSFRNNEENPVALKCKMNYLWNRHPQQFLEGKMSVPHLKSQVIEIEGLLNRLVSHEGISDGERSRMEERHKIALRALSRDSEEGESYRERFEEKYETLLGE